MHPHHPIIALVSSTIYPPDNLPGTSAPRSWIPPAERLKQTRQTIQSLLECGIREIFLSDNSSEADWPTGVGAQLQPAHLWRFPGYQYANKGISEIHALLAALPRLPKRVPILKISARYRLRPNPRRLLGDADVAGRLYTYGLAARHRSLTTRCYLVRNSDLFELLLRRTLRECFRFHSRAVGFRSLRRAIQNLFSRTAGEMPFEDPRVSIENMAAKAILDYGMKFRQIEPLGLTGTLAGARDSVIDE